VVEAIHWHDGLFLTPQHLEGAQRRLAALLGRSEDWFRVHSHGLRALEIDRGELDAGRLRVTRCLARLRDGTQVAVPDEVELEPLELRPALGAPGRSATVLLAVPRLRLGRRNASGAGAGCRYRIESRTLRDEETGESEVEARVLRLQARLLLETAEADGLETLPLVRIEAGAPPRIAAAFVPPLLTLDAWAPLVDRVRGVCQAALTKLEELAAQVAGRALSNDIGDQERLLRVAGLNQAAAGLAALAYTPGVPPAPAFAELCHAVGALGIFFRDRRIPRLPSYDHDDLGTTLLEPLRIIEEALNVTQAAAFRLLDLRRDVDAADGNRPLERVVTDFGPLWSEGWLDEDRPFYLGVRTELNKDQCLHALRQLDMSIGERQKVEANFQARNPGLEIEPLDDVPRGLPPGPNLVYFRFKRGGESSGWALAWADVVRTKRLAIRLNMENAEFLDDRKIQMKRRTPKHWFEFAIYAPSPRL
jgi:type VI secretion system protein ImpJ